MPALLTRRLLLVCCLAIPAHAATFTVVSSSDFGPGTLRQAILDANANPGTDQIVFTVPTVSATTSLPPITSPVAIDGNVGINQVQINGVLFDCSRAFDFSTGSSGSTLTRVWVANFCESLRIGAGVTNVTVTAGSFDSGTILGDENVIGAKQAAPSNGFRGTLSIIGGQRNQLFRNGINRLRVISADANRIGEAGAGIPYGNGLGTLVLDGSSGTIIEGNHFTGLIVSGPAIDISNALASGGGTKITHNSIRNYASAAIVIRPGGSGIPASTGVTILANSIAETGIPIDLGADGVTPNDPAPDADSGPNNLQNKPVLTSAVLTSGQLTVQGTLTSAPLTTYLIELYDNDPYAPQMTILLGSFEVTTDATGAAAFTHTVAPQYPNPGFVVTSTATNRVTGDTSEASAAIDIFGAGDIGLVQAAYTISEGNALIVTVQRTPFSEGTATVHYATADGSAVAPSDYAPTSGTLTFEPGVTSQTIIIPTVADALAEPAESFEVRLSDPTGGAVLGTATATVTINASASAEPIPTLSEWALLALVAGLAMAMMLRAR